MKNAHQPTSIALLYLFLAAVPCAAEAADGIAGTSVVHDTPGGSRENCVAIEPAPDGDYSPGDLKRAADYCAIDFYSGDYALCPKTFSTSPGTLIYRLSGETPVEAFEAKQCRERRIVRDGVSGDPISFKMTMNGTETSATFAPAALLYYHFSRYFHAHVAVPVSVYRSMDRQQHFERVVRTGVAVSSGSGSSAMNRAGWKTLAEGAKNPASYRPTRELYTANGALIYGVMLQTDGRRYGAEINGTRESGWGAGQNRDFQETAPYLALRHDGPLKDAIRHGIERSRQNPILRKAMPTDPTSTQMAFWMTEIAEIVLLDFIFSQQDRVGNIDYVDLWHWMEDGKLRTAQATTAEPPAGISDFGPERIRRSVINDNDAGGKLQYANFAKTTTMLQKLRHFPPGTYQRLQRMVADFEASGPIYRWLSESFGLSERQIKQVVTNAVQAGAILADSCRAGRLQLSLEPETLLTGEWPDKSSVACSEQ